MAVRAGMMAVSVLLASTELFGQYSFQGLGVLPGKAVSNGWDVSGDGLVAVGRSATADGMSYRAFRWTKDAGMQDLGQLGGSPSASARGASADGAVIVGFSNWNRAFRWTPAGGMEDIGLLPNTEAADAYDVSADGSVVAGVCTFGDATQHVYRWREGLGMEDLGVLAGATKAVATAVSGDGTAVVGYAFPNGIVSAFRWAQGDGMQPLGKLAGETTSEAWGVSGDGSVVVGRSGTRAIRWTKATGLVDLGPGLALDVTPDGGVIAGSADGIGCAYWTEGTGWVSIAGELLSHGVDLSGWTQLSAYGVSHDGRVFVGTGLFAGKSQAWIATLGAPCYADFDGSGGLDIDDFLAFQTAYALGDLSADCDESGGLDVDDFICFQTAFGVGCP